jgi:hypothetical protein
LLRASSSKPKKQLKTQKAKPESRNFHQIKSRNLKISNQKTKKQPKPTRDKTVAGENLNG